MTYTKNIWVDQDVERPKTYEVTNNQDGSITLTDSFGIVTELGTPVNSTNMNHIEDGIDNHETRITTLEGASNANTDLSNITNSGTSTGASWAMPSDTYDDLILGASGTAYTAPANGWVQLIKISGVADAYISLSTNELQIVQHVPGISNQCSAFIPVRKGESFYVYYTATGTTDYFRFYYAKGSESEAN